jgi:hypothetical protein
MSRNHVPMNHRSMSGYAPPVASNAMDDDRPDRRLSEERLLSGVLLGSLLLGALLLLLDHAGAGWRPRTSWPGRVLLGASCSAITWPETMVAT